jgi:hypothetical protein
MTDATSLQAQTESITQWFNALEGCSCLSSRSSLKLGVFVLKAAKTDSKWMLYEWRWDHILWYSSWKSLNG